jgi:hypothetical protein
MYHRTYLLRLEPSGVYERLERGGLAHITVYALDTRNANLVTMITLAAGPDELSAVAAAIARLQAQYAAVAKAMPVPPGRAILNVGVLE